MVGDCYVDVVKTKLHSYTMQSPGGEGPVLFWRSLLGHHRDVIATIIAGACAVDDYDTWVVSAGPT